MLPLLVVAFTALGVTVLRPYLTITVRWCVLVAIIILLITTSGVTLRLRASLLLALLAMGGWYLCTYAWSEIPLLTAMKGGAFVLVIFGCLECASRWVQQHTLARSLDFLLPFLGITFVAAVLGGYSESAIVESGPTRMYQGMVNGPNMFGAMIAMCTPVLVWKTYQSPAKSKQRYFWFAITAILAVYLVRSGSRGGVLLAGCVVIGSLWGAGFARQAHLIIGAAVVLAPLLYIFEDLTSSITAFVYKSPNTTDGILSTRIGVWEESYELAKKGGAFGGGYGATIGETNFQAGLSAVGYGREKGNSQLAIMEETGLFGLALTTIFQFILMRSMVVLFQRLRPGPPRALLGIVIGSLIGFLLQAIVEAWWVAPGSPESINFWIMAGVGTALVTDRRLLEQFPRAIAPREQPFESTFGVNARRTPSSSA